jgi:CRP/FNR family transcriptional regulator, cyclic AMP receptor protein
VAALAQDTPTPQWRRLLDLDGDLAEALGPDIASRARDRVGVATVTLAPGAWQPQALAPYVRKAFALIVCDGLIVRELDLAGTLTADLIGPGDIVAFGEADEPLLSTGERWHVSGEAIVAILDERVLPALHVWPAIGSRLIGRAARQAARAAEQRAISQLPRVELRIRAMLWHLADRWGRMGASGVVLPIELTHVALGHLVGARRPTVTLALSELSREGSVTRRDDGAWVLRADSNPSSRARTAGGGAGILALPTATQVDRPERVRVPPVLRSDSALLAERVERLRRDCAAQQSRSVAILERCQATREMTLRRRARVSSP